jgi:predicted phosphodiesterase
MNSKKFALQLVISALAAFLFTQWAAGVYVREHTETSNRATLTGGPMVQIGKRDGLTSIVITWRTLEPSNSQVDFGESPSYGQTVIKEKLTDRHGVVLSHLQPNTRYYYQVRSNNTVLASAFFQTGKVGDMPFRFAVFGDSGSGKAQQYEVAREVERQNVDFILHLGDVVYSHGEDKEYLPRMYLPYKNLLARVPFFPVIGNHDMHTAHGQPWLDNFALPGKERYYRFSYGNALFIALDSYEINSESAEWLERRLARTDKLWKFVFFHEPPFSNRIGRSGNADARNLWVPLFEKYKVDIVFSGHDHMYTHFEPKNGVSYIVEGVGGRTVRKRNPQATGVLFTNDSKYGFGLVDITGPKLRFRHLTSEGAVLDTFTLTKYHASQPPRNKSNDTGDI